MGKIGLDEILSKIDNIEEKVSKNESFSNEKDFSNYSSLSQLFTDVVNAGKGVVCMGRCGSSDGTNLATLIGNFANYQSVYFEALGQKHDDGCIIRCTGLGITSQSVAVKYLKWGNWEGQYAQTDWKYI